MSNNYAQKYREKGLNLNIVIRDQKALESLENLKTLLGTKTKAIEYCLKNHKLFKEPKP